MPLYFQRPENALKRANEFIDVGKKQRALDALYDVIRSRKHRTWQKIHEPIMAKYLELCIELKKVHVAKEGLYEYRNICQQINIKSLEDVIRNYLALAEEKAEIARKESQLAIVDVDDLDQVQTPENLLLSAVSSEGTQDRTDRVVLAPWVKFLWESYRQCLELLRNNSRVERLYHDIAALAFKFCLKYYRRTEFRKLCDNLRAHLGHIYKHQNNQTSVDLNIPESQAMLLETCLNQLDCAIQIELWQEAYKAIEDIHDLINASKKATNPRLLANYYKKLPLVFWKCNNYLFHAAALFRLFYLSREQKKNITAEEISRMSSRVVLATLVIPIPPNRPEIDRLIVTDENIIEKNHRSLSTLLGLPNPPSRAILIKDLTKFGIIQCASPPIQELYHWLETEFHPLKLCGQVQRSIEFINKWEELPELKQYIQPIQNISVIRLVKEISQIYQTIKFSRLLQIVPFVNSFDLERNILEIARRNDLQVRIDHRKQCFYFGSELNVSQHEELIEGPHLQKMPNEQIHSQLVNIYSVFNKAINSIQGDKFRSERKELSKDIVRAYMLTADKDRKCILSRQQIIEERKEMLENLNYLKEAEEKIFLEEHQQKIREAEKKRIDREQEERAKQRFLREQSALKRKMVMEKIDKIRKTEMGLKIFEGLDEEELDKIDPDDLLNKHVKQLDRERKELQSRLKIQEKKIDHMERAKRIEEIPLLQAQYELYKLNDMEFWEKYEHGRVKSIIEERALAVQCRDCLKRLKEDKDKFLERLKDARSSVYQEELAEFQEFLEEQKKKRLFERKQKRKEDRKLQWEKQQEEKKQREVAEQMKEEREKVLAKLKEIEAKKRAKEIEGKIKREREEVIATLQTKQEKEIPDTDSDKPIKKSWRDRHLEKKPNWEPQADKINKEASYDVTSSNWRKKSDNPSRKTEERNRNDDWRKLSKPKDDNLRKNNGRALFSRAIDQLSRMDNSRDSCLSDWRSRTGRSDEDPRKLAGHMDVLRDKRDKLFNFEWEKREYREKDRSHQSNRQNEEHGKRTEESFSWRFDKSGPQRLDEARFDDRSLKSWRNIKRGESIEKGAAWKNISRRSANEKESSDQRETTSCQEKKSKC